jgi:Fe-S-cluster-containing dehydrogenase component
MTTAQADYAARVERNTEGMQALSTGICPGCTTCMDTYGYDEPAFSWQGCDICGSSLGGDMEPYHYLDDDGEIQHGDNACTDCIMFLAYGDTPAHLETEPCT